MTDLNIMISENGMGLLKNLIGQEFISMRHEKSDNHHDVFRRVEIKTTNGRYLINNDVVDYDDYFGGPDELPRPDFLR